MSIEDKPLIHEQISPGKDNSNCCICHDNKGETVHFTCLRLLLTPIKGKKTASWTVTLWPEYHTFILNVTTFKDRNASMKA